VELVIDNETKDFKYN